MKVAPLYKLFTLHRDGKGVFLGSISKSLTLPNPESPKTDHIQRTFSNLFGILASRNDQIWLPPSFITCFIAFLDVFSTKMVDKISRTNDESLSSPSPYLETISNPNKWFCDLPIRDWWRHQNRWIFRKVPYCLCTPPPQFFQCYTQKALFWVQNLQYNFLDWNVCLNCKKKRLICSAIFRGRDLLLVERSYMILNRVDWLKAHNEVALCLWQCFLFFLRKSMVFFHISQV